MLNPIITYTGGGLIPVMDPGSAITDTVSIPAATALLQGQVLGQVLGSGTDVNEVQTLTGSAVGTGTFVVVYDGEPTSALAAAATAATVQLAMEALPSIGTGGVTVGGGPVTGTPLTFTFAGSGTTAAKHHPLMTVINSTNGTLAFSLTTLGCPAGGYWDAYNDAASGTTAGLNVARRLLQYNVRSNAYGQIFYGTQKNLADNSHFDRVTPAYVSGTFKTADLVGIDAAAIADLGVLIAGTTSVLTAAGTQLRMG